MGGKPVAIFCTYGVAPKGALRSMRSALEATGAAVIAQAAFGPNEVAAHAGVFGPRAFGAALAGRATPSQATHVLVE
jgi:hypothetical protein